MSKIPIRSTPSKTRLSTPGLHRAVPKSIESRGTAYTQRLAVIVWWQADSTGASNDAATLANTLTDCLGITPVLLELQTNDEYPGWTLLENITNMIRENHSTTRSTLFFFAYIGQGATNAHGDLVFSSMNNMSFRWNLLAETVFSSDSNLNEMDSFVLLDCCHGSMSPSRFQGPRAMQILAACEPGKIPKPRANGIKCAQRFCQLVHSRQNQGKRLVSVDEIAKEMVAKTSPRGPTPRFLSFGDTRPIVLPIQHGPVVGLAFSTPLSPRSHRKQTQGIAKLTVVGSDVQATDDLVATIEDITEDFQIKLMDEHAAGEEHQLCFVESPGESANTFRLSTTPSPSPE
ncbi:hypothetical protein N7457_007995 [Penicillium paradoxum]|uniref:uncharacterized protein n=1 Tax=Penicillium paradoxum TaxID=176176 RepID=UPI002547E11B|nr:uncharacterized protein N7457_007995 [Penicillium paradoxum]KAJ5773099.1 hypothetical protein N7457_007995 [Penicillium paradoxum]